ncbi:MAG: MarR family winged helix-turn-helix transcriptional regulator [Actinomycetota bacterium]
MPTTLGDDEYRKILDFRVAIRRFLEWSSQQAAAAGVTSTQHQLLLAIRGLDDGSGITVGDVAETLLLKHHSAVELIDRAVENGLVRKSQDPDDRRHVRVALTRKGTGALERITLGNLDELMHLAPKLTRLLRRFEAV